MPDQIPSTLDTTEAQRIQALLDAQSKAAELFHQVEARGLIRPGIPESQLNTEVYDLARELFGISTYWHKRIVRAGVNTLLPYAENPPDNLITADSILFIDLGPVFEESYEADFGRTFVTGHDTAKLKLRDDVARAFADGKAFFHANPSLTAAELFAYVATLGPKYGWEWGGPIAGHLIGQFPHERIPEDKITLYVHPQSHTPMRSLDDNGEPRHWILEIHLVDRQRQIGGFYEELLDIG